jgi:hypothetical protein
MHINLVRKPKGKRPQEVDGRIILEWFVGKHGGKGWTGCIWLGIVINLGTSVPTRRREVSFSKG